MHRGTGGSTGSTTSVPLQPDMRTTTIAAPNIRPVFSTATSPGTNAAASAIGFAP